MPSFFLTSFWRTYGLCNTMVLILADFYPLKHPKVVFLLVYWVFFIYSLSSHPIQYYFEPLREWQHKYFMFFPPHTCIPLFEREKKPGASKMLEWAMVLSVQTLRTEFSTQNPHKRGRGEPALLSDLWPPCVPMACVPLPLCTRTQRQWERGQRNGYIDGSLTAAK